MKLFIAFVLAVIGGGILHEDSKSNHPRESAQIIGCLLIAAAIVVTGFI